MQTIGFKNFRRFENLEPIELSGITFLVGGNNAGKSTVVKAMMLILDNLASESFDNLDGIFEIPSFRLDANRIHDVHIGSFGRALHKPYPEKKELCLESIINNYRICYTLTGDIDSKKANAEVSKIEIENIKTHVLYIFNFYEKQSMVCYNTSVLKDFACMLDENMPFALQLQRVQRIGSVFARNDNYIVKKAKIMQLQKEHEEKTKQLQETDDIVKIANINNELEKIENRISLIESFFDPFNGQLATEDVVCRFPISYGNNEFSHVFIASLLGGIIYQSQDDILEKNVKTEDSNSNTTDNSVHLEDDQSESHLSNKQKVFLLMVMDDLRNLTNISKVKSIEYISAHAVTQKVLFSIDDKNDYMAGVIKDYKNCNITIGSRESLFINFWMKKLNIGLDFEIESIEGEAYTMSITNFQGEKMPLADLGMGAIQMMILLLKLSIIINTNKSGQCTIIVEEPEQNVHPLLQSMLAELFTYVHNKYHFRFVIETHSEYMIRKTQAMIAKGYEGVENIENPENEERDYRVTFENNPFRVYYFPENGDPYDMEYLVSGRFKNSFDTGFFDEAARWTQEMAKKEIDAQPKTEFQW